MSKEAIGRKKARALLHRSGYGPTGRHMDAAADKNLIKQTVKPSALKLKDGGCADGGSVKPRADRLARGGRTKPAKTVVNVIVQGQKDQPKPVPVPVPVPAGAGGPPPGGMPMPPPGAGPGGPPVPPELAAAAEGGAPLGLKSGGRARTNSQRNEKPGMPAGHFAKGGRTKKFPVPMSGGSGGAKGRLEKADEYGA